MLYARDWGFLGFWLVAEREPLELPVLTSDTIAPFTSSDPSPKSYASRFPGNSLTPFSDKIKEMLALGFGMTHLRVSQACGDLGW